MQRAVRFYGKTLGLSVPDQSDEWSEVDAGGLTIGLNGHETAPAGSSSGSGSGSGSGSDSGSGSGSSAGAVITLPSGDLEAEVKRLQAAGVDFTGEISDNPWGRIVPFKDSEGNDLQFIAPPASA